jgi:hypothetical protein
MRTFAGEPQWVTTGIHDRIFQQQIIRALVINQNVHCQHNGWRYIRPGDGLSIHIHQNLWRESSALKYTQYYLQSDWEHRVHPNADGSFHLVSDPNLDKQSDTAIASDLPVLSSQKMSQNSAMPWTTAVTLHFPGQYQLKRKRIVRKHMNLITKDPVIKPFDCLENSESFFFDC